MEVNPSQAKQKQFCGKKLNSYTFNLLNKFELTSIYNLFQNLILAK